MFKIPTFSDIAINSLPILNIRGGSYRELNFFMYDKNNNILIPSTGAVFSWTLSLYDQQDYVILTKYGVTNVDHFTIYLLSTDTENLSGKYIQKSILQSGLEKYVYSLGRGIVHIEPRIGIKYYE